MLEQLPKSSYRLLKFIYAGVAFAVLGGAYCLIRGWPLDPKIVVWGYPLRTWGLAMAASSLIHLLFVLVRVLVKPGARPTFWG